MIKFFIIGYNLSWFYFFHKSKSKRGSSQAKSVNLQKVNKININNKKCNYTSYLMKELTKNDVNCYRTN
ncbi:hypothetical protein CXF68_07655 [Tenacibaculum sp. Bg11-29]|nr:hypothetical protein CXF68_07655 [Tenacibaculum sp. Bg11-29]